jgi:outer membrane biosynthesis protein TonB
VRRASHDANDDERPPAGWPGRGTGVDAAYRAPKGRAPYERLVDLEAVVGTDGRLYRPLVKSSLDPALERLVQGALPLWRFEPARRADAPVAARVALQLVLRVY